jgi:transposase-like protein
MEKLVEQLGMRQLSKSPVSAMATHLDAQVEAFRNGPSTPPITRSYGWTR